jgi:hypothetical protein
MRQKFTFLILLPLVGAALQAQDNTSWDNLSKALKVGKRIQVVQKNFTSFQGRFSAISDDELAFEAEGHETKTIARSEILRVSSAGQRSRNALIGLAVGFGAGAAAGLAIRGNPDVGNAAAAFGIGALGAAGGLGIGAALPANRTLYRAPEPTQPNEVRVSELR